MSSTELRIPPLLVNPNKLLCNRPQDGEDRYAAVTQFEAADARRCFPCWDEPAIKATFALSVTAPKNRTVHSNMPQVFQHSNVYRAVD
jgi:aminopeptidase N